MQKPNSSIGLGLLPTPIHHWPISGLPSGTNVSIKRDDLTGMQLSGNKVRPCPCQLVLHCRAGVLGMRVCMRSVDHSRLVHSESQNMLESCANSKAISQGSAHHVHERTCLVQGCSSKQ